MRWLGSEDVGGWGEDFVGDKIDYRLGADVLVDLVFLGWRRRDWRAATCSKRL